MDPEDQAHMTFEESRLDAQGKENGDNQNMPKPKTWTRGAALVASSLTTQLRAILAVGTC